MKKNILLILLLCSGHASAVNVHHQGMGDVLLIPYYTVNNNLNTTVSVTNPTDKAKAIKINIREGLNGYAVLSYNVYLAGFDTWTFVLVPYNSHIDGLVGRQTVALYTNDNSCAPALLKTGQEVYPDELLDGPQDLRRVREGFIEIIEMGELQGASAGFVSQSNGWPVSCNSIQSAWEAGGIWHVQSGGDVTQDLVSGSGDLMAEADVIHVEEGINYSIPVIALDGFFAENTIAHVSPRDSSLSLDAAAPRATVIAGGKTYDLSFESGIDAVSAVLMADELISTYALDTGVSGKSETIYTQPTRRFYVNSQSLSSEPPYPVDSNVGWCYGVNYGGTEMNQFIFDRESQYESTFGSVGGMIQPPNNALCGSVFVQAIKPVDSGQNRPQISESNNYQVIRSVLHGGENGFIKSTFIDTRPLTATDISTNKTANIMGLPVIGVTLGRFTNESAAPGVLAQYGFSHKVKSKMRLIEQ